MRTEKELLLATRQFAHEQRWRSWWCLWSTSVLLIGLMTIACFDIPWLWRIPASTLAGLTLVRLFILFHDQQHGTILRGSRFAALWMKAFGLLTLNPTSVWKRSHDHHHRHNSKDLCPNIGSFPLMTVDGYARASLVTRFAYRCSRHPLTLALGYLTVFGGQMCLFPLFHNPRRHFDAALSLVCHIGFAWLVFDEVDDLILAWLLPFIIGSGAGAYLFFAQHNFPGVQLRTRNQWDYVFSALHSSSYLKTGPLMQWFTGNIGFHHVHHLNAKIPFYRLPEAMANIEELQSPVTTSLALKDIYDCLRLKLWDPVHEQLVPWPEPAPLAPLDEAALGVTALYRALKAIG